MINQLKKSVTFIATRYKNQPVDVTFYTKEGEKVTFAAKEKAPAKERVRFKASKR